MNKQLKDVAKYSTKRIPIENISVESYVTTDNLLQNKQGKVHADKLPSYSGNVISYKQGDILISNIRPYLKKIWYASYPGGCLSDVLVLSINKKYDSRFVYYALFHDSFFEHMMNGSKGTKMPRGDKNQILDYPIPDLDFHSQQSIAKVLSDLDTKIELNNQINQELEAMAKMLYDYWFVQFEFPNEEGKPYKSSGGKMVYNEELKREVPEGWKNGTLEDISELFRGVTYNANEIKKENDENVIPILRATNITNNVIDLDNMVFVPKHKSSDSQILNKFDILIAMSSGSKDHIGKNGFYYYDKKVAFGAFCAKIVAKKNYRFYLYSYTQSDFMFATINNESLGTNINNLNGRLVKGFKIVIPTDKLINSFNDKVISIYDKISNNTNQNQHLAKLRDWLLPMLMNGQVKVKDAAEVIEREVREDLGVVAEGRGGY